MNIHPGREAFVGLAAQGNVIPVYTDLMADFETPVSAYAKLKESGPSYLFESVEGGENLAPYTRPPAPQPPPPPAPLHPIPDERRVYQPVALPGLPRFTGGAVGFVAY